jgi:hypothetical protein
MKNKIATFLLGILAGALSWAIVSLVSNRFEPFDSDVGFYSGQLILSITALYIGYKKKFSYLIIYILGAYLGMNVYANIAGDSGWWQLLLITSVVLVIFPLAFGVIGSIIYSIRKKLNKV